MSSLTCPVCRQVITDAALDAGACPACGYDGPMVAPAVSKRAWLVATAVVVICGLGVGGFLLAPSSSPPSRPQPHTEAASKLPPASPAPVSPSVPEPAPPPREVAAIVKPGPPSVVKEPRNPWRLQPEGLGPTVRVDAREVQEKKIDLPRGIVQVPDMNRSDKLKLSGRVGMLRIGTVAGTANLDASELEAGQIVISGDVTGRAAVKLNAPNGKVLISGHVAGNARLSVTAPGGDVALAAGSGRFDEAAEVELTARNVTIAGRLLGRSRLIIKLTGEGKIEMRPVEDNATVVFK